MEGKDVETNAGAEAGAVETAKGTDIGAVETGKRTEVVEIGKEILTTGRGMEEIGTNEERGASSKTGASSPLPKPLSKRC